SEDILRGYHISLGGYVSLLVRNTRRPAPNFRGGAAVGARANFRRRSSISTPGRACGQGRSSTLGYAKEVRGTRPSSLTAPRPRNKAPSSITVDIQNSILDSEVCAATLRPPDQESRQRAVGPASRSLPLRLI